MTFLRRLLLGAGVAALLVACGKGPESSLKDAASVEARQFRHPFELSGPTPGSSIRAAEILGILTPADPSRSAKCTRCHTNFRTREGLWSLQGMTYVPFACFNAPLEDKTSAKLILSCLANLDEPGQAIPPNDPRAFVMEDQAIEAGIRALKPRNLGLFSAAVETEEFKKAFVNAGFESLYNEWKGSVFMPFRGTALSKADFQFILSWVLTGMPGNESILIHNGPANVCEDSSKSFIGANVRAHVKRMSEEGEGWNFVNLARGVPMFACEGAACFQNQIDGKDVFQKMDGIVSGKGEVRKLFTLNERSNFWARSSADGRFVAYGSSPLSTVIDLMPLLQGSVIRSMKVEADFDPAFTPDNQAFIFQGGRHGTRICNQSLLTKSDLVTIDFVNQGCSESNLEIGLYQAIGNSLDNGDITTVNGSFKSDSGRELVQDTPPLFPENSSMTISTVRRSDSTNFEKVSSQMIPTPFEANWMLSSSQKLAMGTISATNEAKRARHGGYHLVMTDAEEISARGVLPAWNDDDSALLCVGHGEKPTLSFDERYLVYYAYEQHKGREADVMNPVESSADLYVIDLLGDGQARKITNMPKGQYAQFPHFRSDGWLYFSIYDANTQERSVAATDTILKF